MPEGYGGYIVSTDDITMPKAFHEPFTGTDDWILKELTQTLPSDGQYYLVEYIPSGQFGKVWVAFGTEEKFGLAELLNFGQIVSTTRDYHEVSGPGGICPLAGFGTLLLSLGLVPLLMNSRGRHR